MTDLEITRLCAEAMGWRLAGTRPDFDTVKAIPVEQFPGASHYQYAPLHDDAQAMALVKKFNMGWDKEAGHEWHVALRDGNMMFVAHNMNINRAICECVAKMERERAK